MTRSLFLVRCGAAPELTNGRRVSDQCVERCPHNARIASAKGMLKVRASPRRTCCRKLGRLRKRSRADENESAHVTVSEPIAISYGRGHLTLRMPAKAEVTMIAKGKLNKIVDPAAAVRRTLAEPIDSPPLVELARGRKSACILICDITRPVPNHLFLRPIIETLVASGIALDRIVILVATGLHRPNVGEELAELVGDPWVMARVRIENHDARNDAD